MQSPLQVPWSNRLWSDRQPWGSPRGRTLLWRERGPKALLFSDTGNTFIIWAFPRPRCYSWLILLATKSWTTHRIPWPFFICIFHTGKAWMITLGWSLPWKQETASLKMFARPSTPPGESLGKQGLAAYLTPSLAVARFLCNNCPPHIRAADCWGCLLPWRFAPTSVLLRRRRAIWLGRDRQSYGWMVGWVFYV